MDYFEKELEKLNVLNAFEAKPASGLKEILKGIQTKELMKIAAELKINYDSVDRKLLINADFEEIQNMERIENALMLTRSKEFELFIELLDKEYIQENILLRGNTGYLQDSYIVFSFYDEEKIYFLIPEEIKQIYKQIDHPQFLKKYNRFKQIDQYLNICITLYGAIKKQKFIEIFNRYNDEKLGNKEFESAQENLFLRQQKFYEFDDAIVCDYFSDDNMDELEFLLKDSDDIPFFMPLKERFLKFEDDLYYEMTPQLQRLRDYILKNMCPDEKDVSELIDDVELVCSLEEPFQSILDEFERHKIFFDSQAQVYEIAPLIYDVSNNVRTWTNRGHTHFEISQITGEPVPEWVSGPVKVPIKNNSKILKINRNDLCPCGSGKKYKRCCGQ